MMNRILLPSRKTLPISRALTSRALQVSVVTSLVSISLAAWVGGFALPAAWAAQVPGGEEPADAINGPTAGLTAQEERGKRIYLTGESPGEEAVTAVLGQGVVVPASTLPCGNCHGRDGRGVSEGGVDPTNLTWSALTKPYGVRHESGREHPPYTVRSLKRAIAMGLDPAGNELHTAMPRYRMSLEDMDALVAYMRKLGDDPDPGIEPGLLHLATLLPPEGPASPLGEAIEGVLDAYFERLNESGGLYNRRLVLHTHSLAANPDQRRADLESFLDQTPIFALVGPFIAGVDRMVPEVVGERDLPMVGPFTLHPRQGFPLIAEVFYLLPGLATQGRVLVDEAVERHGTTPARAVVIFPPGGAEEEAAAEVEEQAEVHGWTVDLWPVEERPSGEALARRLDEAGAEVVFALHSELGALTPELLGRERRLYLPGAFGGVALFDLPRQAADRLVLSFPTLPVNQTPRGLRIYQELTEQRPLPAGHRAVQLSTLAAAEVLAEGIKQAGRDLSREKLMDALEGLYDFDTGLTPRLTFNPNRRIGALGAYLVTLDVEARTFRPLGPFREPRER